jgi:hypothetical protein
MPRISAKNPRPTAIALLVASLACLGMGACGSSSSGSSATASSTAHTTAEATPTTSASTTPASTAPASTTTTRTAPTKTEPAITSTRQFDLIYECMIRNGIKLPPLKILKSAGEIKINTNTPRYKATLAKCRHEVLG